MGKYNIRNFKFEDFYKMPATLRFDILERMRVQYEYEMKNNPLQTGLDKLM